LIRVFLSTIFLFSLGLQAAEPTSFRGAINSFVEEMVAKHQFEPIEIQALMKQARYQQKIIDAISRPAEGTLTWARYRPIFLSGSRAAEGVKFWQENQTVLDQATAKYGVPAEIIVAIIGVETRYGKHAGKYKVIDALSTLAFAYPKRGAFFKRQLEEFLLMSREHNVAAATALGSYAGAMGQPQFIPSSFRAYAVDFDQDGKTDLWDNRADIIGSVAAYFSRHHWRPNAPVAFRTQKLTPESPLYVKAGRKTAKPNIQVSDLKKAGLVSSDNEINDTLSTLVHLKGKQGSEFWITLHNFYVITRYNHSNLYAMAVYQLSEEIRTLYIAAKKGS